MPFEAVQSNTMWVVLFLALDQNTELDALIKIAGPDNIPMVKNLDISPNEGIFLLTALSNMAIARNGVEDKELIEAIGVLIIEVSSVFLLYIGLYCHFKSTLEGRIGEKSENICKKMGKMDSEHPLDQYRRYASGKSCNIKKKSL